MKDVKTDVCQQISNTTYFFNGARPVHGKKNYVMIQVLTKDTNNIDAINDIIYMTVIEINYRNQHTCIRVSSRANYENGYFFCVLICLY